MNAIISLLIIGVMCAGWLLVGSIFIESLDDEDDEDYWY